MVPANYVDQLQNAGDEEKAQPAIKLTPQDVVRLQAHLAQAIEDNEECPICFGVFNEPRITSCSHIFCLPWYEDMTVNFFYYLTRFRSMIASQKSFPGIRSAQWFVEMDNTFLRAFKNF